MEYLLSALYTAIDASCILIFLDTFAPRRLVGIKHHLIAATYTLFLYIIVVLNMLVLNYSTTWKTILVILCGIIFGRILYNDISTLQLLFLIVLEYLLTYLLSFMSLHISAIVCGVSVSTFRQKEVTPFIISSVVYYFLQVVFILTFNKLIQRKWTFTSTTRIKSTLYLLFPSSSFFMLLILLRITSKQGLSDGAIIVCCWTIFLANMAVLYLLGQINREEQNREKLLALDQQLQLQRKNIEETLNWYSTQRKQVHDFRAHLNVLSQLIGNQDYDTVEKYLKSILDQQSERIFLVDCHHSVLNALFNSKISEATKHNIDVHFAVNDLSELSLDAVDLTVLLSNLLDNAIEGCKQVSQNRSIQVQACVKTNQFNFIIRNSSLPVHIVQNEIQSTKSSQYLHGFGLSNIKAIISKYHGEYAMSYKENYFQFIFEIPLNPHI